MAYTLKDDLLKEFRDERIMLKEQLELLDPLSEVFRKPAAQHMFSDITLLVTEYACYLAGAAGVAFALCMHLVYPFSTMKNMFYNELVRNAIGSSNLVLLALSVYGLTLLGSLFLFFIGRLIREIRLKNEIVRDAGNEVKKMLGIVLERKAVADTIEQRHMLALTEVNPLNNLSSAAEPVLTVFTDTAKGYHSSVHY